MATLRDIYEVQNREYLYKKLFGIAGKAYSEYLRRLRKVGNDIIKDFNISVETAKNLPESTKLGPKATKSFNELKKWLATIPPHAKRSKA